MKTLLLALGLTAAASTASASALQGYYSDFVSGKYVSIGAFGEVSTNFLVINNGATTALNFNALNIDAFGNTGIAAGYFTWFYPIGFNTVRCDFDARMDVSRGFGGALQVRLSSASNTGVDAFGRCVSSGYVAQTFLLQQN